MFRGLRENRNSGQVILEVTLVLVCLALLAMASTKLFANLNLNVLERWKAYRQSRLYAVNDPRKLTRKSLEMPFGGTRPMSDPLAFLFYSPHTRIISEAPKAGYGGLSAYISEKDLFAEPRLLSADIYLEEYDTLANLLTPYKMAQADLLSRNQVWSRQTQAWYPEHNIRWLKRLSGEISVFTAGNNRYIVRSGTAASDGAIYAEGLFSRLGHYNEIQEAAGRGENGAGARFKLQRAMDLIKDVLDHPTIPGPFDPDPASRAKDYGLDDKDPDYERNVRKVSAEARLARSSLDLLWRVLNSDLNAGNVERLLTADQIADASRGSSVDEATLSQKIYWGDILCRGYVIDGEIVFDGLKMVPKCIECNGDQKKYDEDLVTENCDKLCWFPLIKVDDPWYSGRKTYITYSGEDGEPWTFAPMGEPNRYVWKKVSNDVSGIRYGHYKAIHALEEAVTFMNTKDVSSVIGDAVSKDLKKQLKEMREALSEEEIQEMARDAQEQAQARREAELRGKSPFISAYLKSDITALAGACEGFSRDCTAEEVRAMKTQSEEMLERHKSEMELTEELQTTMESLDANLGAAVNQLDDEDQTIRQQYTHYADLAYIDISALYMAAEAERSAPVVAPPEPPSGPPDKGPPEAAPEARESGPERGGWD